MNQPGMTKSRMPLKNHLLPLVGLNLLQCLQLLLTRYPWLGRGVPRNPSPWDFRVTGGARRFGLGDLIMIRIIAVVACGLSLAACSVSLPDSFSLPDMNFFKSSPAPQALRIESEPPGAEAKTASGQSCRTPCELSVAAADDISLTVALNGYQPQTVSVRKDAADSSRLAPNPVHVELQPTTPPKKVATKRKSTVAAKPAPAQAASAQPAQAPAAAPAAPAPAVEASAAGTK